MKKKFSFRGFISLYITLSFVVMVVSGIILYFAPPGRVANWSYWRFLGLLKSQWQAIHTIFTFIFIIASGFHLFFNWKPFVAYLKSKYNEKVKLRIEFVSSFTLVIFIFVFTTLNIIPFSSVMDFGESLKQSWSNEKSEPPIPHAEELTIAQFAKTIKVPLEDVKSKLVAKGIQVESDEIKIQEIADKHNLSPNNILSIVNDNSKQQVGGGEGRGYGRKTIEQICNENNFKIGDALANLKLQGITAESNEKLKDIAMRNNRLPIDIANIALGIEENEPNH